MFKFAVITLISIFLFSFLVGQNPIELMALMVQLPLFQIFIIMVLTYYIMQKLKRENEE
ncbi:hypothetical protein [Cytobacillus horneckiae]|uniref:hypothetical protein n=1 Tax=Cytobacillus horneckiae TaxID=549687 RepID=UPI003D1B1FBC